MYLSRFASRVFISRMLVVVTACALLTASLSTTPTAAASGVTKPERLTLTAATSTETARARAVKAYDELPLQFESNKGQADERFDFISRASGYAILLSSTEAVFTLRENGSSPEHPARTSPLTMKLAGARHVTAHGEEKSPGRVNYFKGRDAGKYLANVPAYARVSYKSVYEGVDLVYYGNRRSLEYDFVVAPGADAGVIKLEFDGYDELEVDAAGDLSITRGGARVSMRKPVLYQLADGARRPVAGRYVRAGANRVGFEVGEYDHARPLVIDPVLGYSTFLGGVNGDWGFDIQVDGAGNAYVAGTTSSPNFLTTAGAPQKQLGNTDGNSDGFVTKINADGTVAFSTYIGGNKGDFVRTLALGPGGTIYLTGGATSTDFPTTTGAYQTTTTEGDFFVTKLSAAGDALLYSTYFGAGGIQTAHIAVDAAGDIYLAGVTSFFRGFPTTADAYRKTPYPSAGPIVHGADDGFVAKIHPAGASASDLVYSSYLGGSEGEYGGWVTVSPEGFVYVAGVTESTDFPTTADAVQPTPSTPDAAARHAAGLNDVFLVKMDLRVPGAGGLVYSTYLGGAGNETSEGMVLDRAGNVYLAGRTTSGDFPTTKNTLQPSPAGGSDAYVVKINPSRAGKAGLVYATYLGGSADDTGGDIAVDTAGNAYITGDTRSTILPVTVGAFQPSIGGISDVFSAPGGDAFVAKLNAAGTALVYFSYLGGSGGDGGSSIALDPKGNAYLTGYTFSNNFPLSANALQATHGGSFDAYVARVNNPSSFSAAPAPVSELTAYAASAAALPNPIDDAPKFVRQQYLDFLNREPDADGLAFWTGEIEKCGADAACREVKRINVSAAFFLSIEFQQTGYLVHRLYRASHARAPRLTEFAPDTRLIREGVVVNAANWEQRLEANKRAFLESWVQRPDFRALYDGKGNAEYVDALFANAGVQPSTAERGALVDGLAAGTETRATVLRKVAENDSFARKEFNRAFVLMQYFGYLQRSPDDPPDADLTGYNFWLSKLDEFDGNFVRAEMVKAFISAGEYRKRFGQD